MAFGPRQLKELRESLGINQRVLADALNVSQAYVSLVESGEKPSQEFLGRAEQYLREVIAPVRKGESVRSKERAARQSEPRIGSFKSKSVTWAWTAVSHERESGDIFDHAKIGESSFAFLLTDVVGHGVRASWQSAQIRFGFQTIAASLNQYSNTPLQFLGPISQALRAVRIRRLAPPSLAIICLSSKTGAIEVAAFGLPSPLHFSKRIGKLESLPVEPADQLRSDILPTAVASTQLEVGDTLFLVTDGFLSWLKDKKGLDASGVTSLFVESAKFFSGKASAIVKSILSASTSTGKKAPAPIADSPLDDATLFVITRGKNGWGE